MTGAAIDHTADALAPCVPLNGPSVACMPQMEHECALTGVRAIAHPPGRTELYLEASVIGLNFVPDSVQMDRLSIGGTDYSNRQIPSDGLAWYPVGADIRLAGENPSWELLVEIDPTRLGVLAGEELDGRRSTNEFVLWAHDPLASASARLLIGHLRQPVIDPLFVEGLTLAVIARGLHLATGGLRPPSTRGYDRRIRRAIDYIEANIARTLSVAEIASVAAMSPSHFARSFRAAVGESVAAHVRRRRFERARDLVERTDRPLGVIAHQCGYADASHMTRVFRRLMERVPSEIR